MRSQQHIRRPAAKLRTFGQHDHVALAAGDAHPRLVKVPHVKVACTHPQVQLGWLESPGISRLATKRHYWSKHRWSTSFSA